MAAWTVTSTRTGATRSFPTREAARNFTRSHPTYKRVEYSRRVAPREGLSRSQLRGHASTKAGEQSIRGLQSKGLVEKANSKTLDRYYQAVDNVAHGDSLSKASRKAGISPETVKRLDEDRDLLSKTYEGRKFTGWEVEARAVVPILTREGDYFRIYVDSLNASLMGGYWASVRWSPEDGNWGRIRQFRGTTIRDVEGRTYRLNTNPDEIMQFWASLTDDQKREFDRAFQSERVTIRRG